MKFLLLFLGLLLTSGNLSAQEAEPTPPAAEEESGEKEPVVLSVEDETTIRELTGQEATVEGKIHHIFWVRDNVLMITFREEKSGFIAVSFARYREELDKGFNGDITEALRNQKIRITGNVSEYNSRPQIVIETPDQIEVVEE